MSDTWEDELDRIKALVQAWESHARSLTLSVPTDEAHRYRDVFDRFTYKAFLNDLDNFKRSVSKTEWTEIGGFLHAPPIEIGHPPVLFPVVRFVMRVVDGQVELMVRLATFFVNATQSDIDPEVYGAIDAHGWRFETADVPGNDQGDGLGESFTHYPHAQPIMAWAKKGKGLFPPNREEPFAHEMRLLAPAWNESRPAFPLSCNTPAGVIIAAMTTLYGSVRTNRMLETTPNDPALKREIKAVLRYPIE